MKLAVNGEVFSEQITGIGLASRYTSVVGSDYSIGRLARDSRCDQGKQGLSDRLDEDQMDLR